MDPQQTNTEASGDGPVLLNARSVKKRGKTTVRTSEAKGPGRMSSLSVQCPSEIVAIFEEASAAAGINRQQLFREALETYAALLAAGHRTYRQPGMRRAG